MKGLLLPFALAAVAVAALPLWRKARKRERALASLFPEESRVGASLPTLHARLRALRSLAATRSGGAALFVTASLALFLLTRNLFLSLMPWPAWKSLRGLARGRRRARHAALLEEQALELIDSLSQSLRSGLSLLRALEASRDDVGDELAAEVTLTLRDVSLGAGLEESLTRAVERTPSPSLRLTFTILALLHGKGGDLPRILERLRKRVQEGLEVRRETRMLTSQSRASGYLVASLPLAFLVLQGILNPRSLRPLLATPTGNLMVATAVALNAGAFLFIRRMVNPRS